MSEHQNEFGQPVGIPIPEWRPRPWPPSTAMTGCYCVVEPLDIGRHLDQLWAAHSEDAVGRNWTYLPVGPFRDLQSYSAWLRDCAASRDPFFHSIVEPKSGLAAGLAAFMRINPQMGVMEVGHVNFSPRLQRTRTATEAMFLMMRRAFDELGCRRYEWKCDSLNEPSRRAALRLGFKYEGTFRQDVVYKGRSRDTAWFSIIDAEWPVIRERLETWLAPANFDASGRQIRPLRVPQ